MTGLWSVSYVALWLVFFALAATMIAVLFNLGVVSEAEPPGAPPPANRRPILVKPRREPRDR